MTLGNNANLCIAFARLVFRISLWSQLKMTKNLADKKPEVDI